MACNICQQTKPIPLCVDGIILGVIQSNIDVYIVVTNETTGYVHRQLAASGNYGDIELLLSKPDTSFYNKDSAYSVVVTDLDNNILAVSIDSVEYTCFSLSFYNVYDEVDNNIGIETIILETI